MNKHLVLAALIFLAVGCSPSESETELYTKRLHLEVRLAQGSTLDDQLSAELIGDDSAQSVALDLEAKEGTPEVIIGSCTYLIGKSPKRTLVLHRDNHKSQRFVLPIPSVPMAQAFTDWTLPNDVVEPGLPFWHTMNDSPVEQYQIPIEEQHAVRYRIEDWENKYR